MIEIRSESLLEDEMFDLHTFMCQTADAMTTVSMTTLVDDALGWLEEGGINVKGVLILTLRIIREYLPF